MVVLPPYTLKIEKGIFEYHMEDLCSFSPVVSDNYCSPYALVKVNGDKEIPINFWNPTGRYHTLKKGSVVGNCMETQILTKECSPV